MQKFLKLVLTFCAALAISAVADAQIPAELLQKYQQLSPAEQQKVLQQAQQGGGASAAPAPDSAPLVESTVVTPLPAASAKGKEETELAEGAANEGTAQRLKAFGYDLFAGAPTTFAPATDIPVPTDYIVGPGDVIEIQLFGKQNAKYSLTVQRDGSVQIPELGPIQVAGLQFNNLQEMLQQQVSKRLIGVSASVTLGQLRSIRIFVLGDALRPGSYTVSSLSTVTNALFVSGGIAETGSLRKIQLKRRGRVVSDLDLYDLLLRGDTSRDNRLEPGDVIFIPPVGPTVGVSGEVRRPAIYELNGSATTADVVELAGGLLSTAAPAATRLDRIDDNKNKSVLDLDLAAAGRNMRVRDGDILRIPSVLDRIEGAVFLRGHIYRPEAFKWNPRLTMTDILPGPEAMKPIPDLDFGLIVREDPVVRTISVIPFSPRQVFSGEPGYKADLQPRDTVYVFGLEQDRAKQIEPALETLRLQARKTGQENIVSVAGQVHVPGSYPLYSGMKVRDLIQASLDVTPDADRNYAILVREDLSQHEISVLTINLRKALDGDPAYDLALAPKDRLLIFNARASRNELLDPVIDRLRSQAKLNEPSKVVRVNGDVRFPGAYPLTSSMSITDLVGIAGGLAEPAYALTAEVSRSTADQTTGYSVAPIAINLADETSGQSTFTLQADDTLRIKRLPNFKPAATVILEGEFMFPGEYRVQDGETMSQLIQRAGGFTKFAYTDASVFMRESLRQTEAKRLQVQKQQLEKDLLRLQLESSKSDDDGKRGEALKVSAQLVNELSQAEAVGRMAINLPRVAKGDKAYDVRLENGDKLIVGRKPEAISVFGEVLYPTSHQYRSGTSASDYINLSGGSTQTADRSRIYLVRANGEIIADAGGPSMLAPRVQPGDTVIVPYDAARIDKLKLTSNIVQIVSQLAITAASMAAIGAF